MERRAFTAVIVSTTRHQDHTRLLLARQNETLRLRFGVGGRVLEGCSARWRRTWRRRVETTNDEQRTNGVITRAS